MFFWIKSNVYLVRFRKGGVQQLCGPNFTQFKPTVKNLKSLSFYAKVKCSYGVQVLNPVARKSSSGIIVLLLFWLLNLIFC